MGVQPQDEGGFPPYTPPPQDQSDHRGNKQNLPLGKLIGPFLVHKLSGSIPPPPPNSLLIRPGAGGGGRGCRCRAGHVPGASHGPCRPHRRRTVPTGPSFPRGSSAGLRGLGMAQRTCRGGCGAAMPWTGPWLSGHHPHGGGAGGLAPGLGRFGPNLGGGGVARSAPPSHCPRASRLIPRRACAFFPPPP